MTQIITFSLETVFGVRKSGDTIPREKTEKTDFDSLPMSVGNTTGIWLRACGNVTTNPVQNILDCQRVTSGGFLFVKAKYN